MLRIERAEQDGKVTLNTMKKLAASMGCEFHYAIVPRKPTAQLLADRAHAHAVRIVRDAAMHIALEDQAISSDKENRQVEILERKLLDKMPSWFWEENLK